MFQAKKKIKDMSRRKVRLEQHDALVIVDVQNDFLPGGTLEVPGSNAIIPVLNKYIEKFLEAGLTIIATRDWHPPEHCSFMEYGGQWPPHCIRGSSGAEFSPDLLLPKNTTIISKATAKDRDAYSGFEGTDLDNFLKEKGIKRLFIGGLATDYCVLNTVRDALKNGYEVYLLVDAIKAVNVNPDDGANALKEMKEKGAVPVKIEDVI